MAVHKNFNKIPDILKNLSGGNSKAYISFFSADMLQRFARDTPVDTGRATANWKVGINEEPRPNEDTDRSVSAAPTVKKAKEVLKGYKIGDDVFIKNSVRSDDEGGYIIKLEQGHSKQAPTGMFLKNLSKWRKVAKNAQKKIGL